MVYELSDDERKRRNRAYRKVQYALKAGKLIRSGCVMCGAPKVQAHHADYDKPLEVDWLCTSHHRREHTQRPQHSWRILRMVEAEDSLDARP